MSESAIKIPGYRIEEEIGRGGMARVYRALQESLDREVALKVMNRSLSEDPIFCERFLKEGRIVAKLSHRNVVTVYEIGRADENFFLAMEYICGATLRQYIKQHSPVPNALEILSQLAGALGYAHARGFIHRDVKPANILFRDNGSVVLTDFGIAKPMSGATQMTVAGFAVGTPEYMSPEQAMGQAVDGRSDLYSLGVTFYEMLTGKKPFLGEDPLSTIMQHARNPVPRLAPELSCYQSIVDQLLAKKPSDRFSNAEELMRNIGGLAEPGKSTNQVSGTKTYSIFGATRTVFDGTAAPELTAAEGKRDKAGGLRRWPMFAAAGLLLLGIAAGGYWVSNQPARPVAEPLPNTVASPEQKSQPIPSARVFDAATQRRIERLLEVADVHAAVGRLKEPPGSNAYEAYQLVLEIDPENQQAQQGIRQIQEKGDSVP